jgi:hypothetical protein
MKARLLGMIAMISGLLLGWFFVLGPLRDAEAGRSIKVWEKAVFAAPIFTIWGLAMLCGGDTVRSVLMQRSMRGKIQRLIAWPLIAVMLLGAGLTYFWMRSKLAVFGYSL